MDAPAHLDPEDDEDQEALIEALRQRQKQDETERAGLQETLSGQRRQAAGLRNLSLISSLGANPLLQGVQRVAGDQGAQLEGLAARTEQRLANTGGMDPLALERLKQSAKRLGFQQQQGAEKLALAKQNLARLQRAAASAAGQKAADNTDKQTRDFGDEIVKSGAPGFYVRYDQAKDIIDRNPGDLPGFGRIEGRLPDDVITEEGRTLRQAVNQLLSEYRKGQTGAGMSDSERAEYGRITGLLQTGDEKSVRQGIDALKRAVDERVRATAGAFRPEAVERYTSRVPRVGAALALPQDAQGQPTLDAQDKSKATAPATGENLPRIVPLKSATGEKLTREQVVASVRDGEVVRIPMGKGTYKTYRKSNGRLVAVKE